MSTSNIHETSGLKRLFPLLTNENVNMKKEIMAGITTFLTMAYIIAVNPNILSKTGMNAGALVTATCFSAALGCFLMGFIANLPFALASGMGLNAFFAFTVVLKGGISWQTALTAVFCEGIIFIVLTLFKIREAVVNSIPENMKHAVTGGFIGLILISILDKKNVRGSILYGIVLSSLLAWGYALLNPAHAKELGIYLPSGIFKYESMMPVMGKLDFSLFTDFKMFGNLFVIICTFLFVDFFDTVGTLVGVCSKADMLDENGNVPNVGRALMADAIATTAGAALGVSTVTTYVESSTGVIAGGRTGWTAITTGVLFLISMFFSPIFISIPGCATAPALIYVGYLMLSSVKNIDLHDVLEGVPSFITITTMALTYSIGDGLTLGILSYVLINLFYNLFSKKEDRRPVSWVMIILGALFIVKLLFMS